MNVYFRTYKLTALKASNRFSSSGVKVGVHLKIKKRFTDHFADYFPHEALGDKPIELFLEEFKFQEHEYEQKVFHFLLNDERLRSQKIRPLLNHQLWDGKEEIKEKVIKYKLQDATDLSWVKAIKIDTKIRLDANGLFNRNELSQFIKEIPAELKSRIEYLEDPMLENDWSGIPLPLARDFISGSHYDVLIHKPNARFMPTTDKKVIFSSYMGSDLGRWHAFCELLEKGNLSEYHGIMTPSLYVEQKLQLNDSSVTRLYNELSFSEWKSLCLI